MKSMNNDDINNNNNDNLSGFSLSPDIKMEVQDPHHHNQTLSSSPASAVIPPPTIPSSFLQCLPYGFYYGLEAENCGLFSPLPVMPLRSDGSLCMMEGLSRSQPPQGMVTTSTPKLEDFFGGTTMGTHHYESNDREAMALSLDSMYDHQNPENEPNSQNCQSHPQENSKRQDQHQQEQILVQEYQYYNTGFRSHEILPEEKGKETQVADCNLQLPTMADDGLHGMKNWVSMNCPTEHSIHQKIIGCISDNGGQSGSIRAIPYGDLQSLSLSMSPASQSSCVTSSQQISHVMTNFAPMETKKRGPEKGDQKKVAHRKSIDTFGQRTSQYRGVTRHRWTGRYEAHLWDNSCKKEGQNRKGRQVYLGGYDMEEKAARAYDLAALKYWGPSTHINFPLENYQKELEEINNMTREEYVAHLRRKSSGFSRGASIYRGVTRHHQHGRWQARIGRVAGNKDLYLGTFSTQEEAAEAYDIAAIKFRGVTAVTNFDITRYNVERIMASNTLLPGEHARRNKEIGPGNGTPNLNPSGHNNNTEIILSQKNNGSVPPDWKTVSYPTSQQLEHRAPNISMTHTYNAPAFSMAPDIVIGIDTMSSAPQEGESSAKIGNHLSNASSLVTSLSSSREGSPDGTSAPLPFAIPRSGSKLFTSPANTVNSWIPPAAAELRPAVSVPHMPVVAGWTDS